MGEDVLERADAYRENFADRSDAMPLIRALSAEVRELRKDRDRLDWLGDAGVSLHSNAHCYAIHDAASRDFLGESDAFREAIDAAMARED